VLFHLQLSFAAQQKDNSGCSGNSLFLSKKRCYAMKNLKEQVAPLLHHLGRSSQLLCQLVSLPPLLLPPPPALFLR
ncbi:unnamed protein product, partial [Amoebophrya sp. A25]